MRKLTISILPVFIFMMSAVFSYAQFMHKPHEDKVCMGKYAPASTEAVTSIFYEDFSGADFPPAGWTVVGDGLTNWIAANSGYAGGTAPEAQFYWNPNFVGVSRLVTSEISTSGYSEVLLSLKHFLDDYGLAGDYTLYIETTSDGGTTWNPVWSLVDPGADVGPEDLFILIDNGDVGSDNFQLAFTFDGDSYELNWWSFDNIEMSEALSYDAEATSLLVPSLVGAGDAVTPIGIVSNKGSQTISFDVVVEILENGTSVYSETMSVTSLPSFETETLTFPQWNSYEGNFVVEMTTLLSGDENPDNDMLSKDLEALAGVIFIKPLYEEFTSSTCGPCASANPILDAVLQANPGTHSLIKYQMDWPGSGDPYYTEEGGVRKDYYGVSYVPDMYINADQHYPGDMTQALYDSYIGIPTALSIEIVTAEIDENYNITVEANIDVASNYAAGLTAHIVVVEKVTVGNALSNGETEFFNVMMKMLPDAGGTTLPALNPGNTTTLSESYDMSLTFMEQPNDLAVVIFVQDDSDKSIIQSETADVAGEFDAFDVTIIVEDEDGAAIMGAEVFLEGNGTLTSNASGEVLFDGVFPGSYAYEIVAAGFYDASGDLEVIDQNVTVTVTMITPDFFWFEMFDEGIPADWTMHFSGWDYLYWYDGKVIFFRQSGTDNPLMLVSPLIDISTADMLYFDLGETNGTPPVVFGTVTDPSDPDSFTELETYYPGADWETYEFDLTTLNGGESEVYLAWKLNTTDFSFFSFDNVIITADGSGGEYCLDGLYVTGCSFGDGLVYWDFADVNIPNIACDGVPYIWYHDWTNEVHHVMAGMDYVLTVEGGYGGEHLYVWVDLNEDYYMSEDELLVNEWVLEEGGVPYQTTITIPADAPLGQFTVRFRTNWETPIPESCFGVNFGNMADFTIEISEGGSPSNCEDFDALTPGGYVAEQLGGMWTTWSNAPGTAEDAMVTDAMSNSPSNSFIVAPNVDMIYKFDDAAITTGMAAYSHYMYVASGTTGYFNVQSDPTPGVAWVIELYFNDGGAGQFIVDAVTTNFTYTQGVWFMVEVNFDLDADMGEVWFDGTLVHSFTTANSIGGIDYFGAAATDAAYYDDVCFETGGVPPTLEPPTNLTYEVMVNDVHLEWDAPAGTGGDLIEIAYDDGTAEANWWISVPSTANDMMAKRLTMPEDGTIQEIAFFTYSPAGESFNDIIVCADNGSGQPNLAAAYENFGVTTPPFITGDWLFLTLSSPFALSAGEDFWIVANWQGGNNNGPFIGGDQTIPPSENRNYWSNVPGTWNLWTSDRWMMRAYYSVPGESYDGEGLQRITHMNDKSISLPVSATTNPVAFEGTQSWKAPTIITGAKALNGYNVYRDGSMIGYTTFEFYDDMDLDPGMYDYYVTAVYDEGESDPSNTVSAEIEEIIQEECEDFDDLTVGGYVAGQLGGLWTTWSNAPGTAEDGIVSDDYSISPSNSMLISGTNDVFQLFDSEAITQGVYEFSLNIYVPTGFTGYFNLQKTLTPGQEWGFQVMFEDDGTQVIDGAGAAAVVYPFDYDTWINCVMIVDLDMDWMQYYVDGALVHEYQWTLGTFGTPGLLSLGGANYYANPGATGTPPGAYFDDICFTEVVVDPCQNFDDLTVGGYVAEQLGGFWTTWSNAPGTAEDAIVTDAQSYSGPNSFIVDPNVDMIFQFGNNPITTGAWLYSNMMYIPSGKTGYFNVQSEPTPGVAWVIELYFNAGGAGQVIVDGATTAFTYEQDEWFWAGVNIDLDNDAGDFWIDDAIVHSFVTANSIGGIDYFGAAATDGAYYDDVCFGEGYTIQPPVLPAPTDLTAEAVGEDIELNWTAPAGPVGSLLVVDRDGSADLAFTDDWQFIQPALDALGTDYTYFEVTDLTTDGPDLATMQEHDMILWLCGEGWQQNQTMSSNDENNLEAYLDGGGNLFISGHDYLWDKYPSAGAFSPGQFPYDYLGVASVVQDNWFISSPSTASAAGVNGSFGEGITFTVADIYTTDKDGLYIDQLTALDAGLFQVTSPAPTGVGAVQFDGGGFRTAFTTLSIAAITDQSDIEEVLAAAFGWFSAGDSDELLGYNIYHNLNGGAFSLLGNTTSTQYTHTAPGIGTHCYYVTAVYDEGESDPSNTDCETLTGIENYLASQVQVYPNPAKDAVHIQSDGEIQSIVVYNFSGQVAYEKEVHSTHFTINVSQFNPGVYLFRIRTDGETITQRIVVE